jgi:hypothetical protein
MKKNPILPMIALCVAASHAQDVIVFENGDTLTGKILKQNIEHVYFKPDSFGSVSLQTKDIAEIRIEVPVIGEVSIPHEAITEPEPAHSADEQSSSQKVTRKDPSAKKQPTPKEKFNWSGQAGLTVAMRESNTLRRSGDNFVERNEEFESYRVYGNVKWDGEINNLKWDWIYRYSRTDIRKNDDFLNLTQNYQHDFTKKLYAGAKTVYQEDFRRGIESEYLQTAEVGVKWYDSPKLKFYTSAGGGYHKYARIQDKYSDAQGKFILDESLRWQMINSLTLFQKYTHLGNLEKYHFVFTSGLENKLIRDVFLRFEYRLDRDTDVNYDKSYYDKALLTSLLYKF